MASSFPVKIPWTRQPQVPVVPRPEWRSVYSFGSGNFDLVTQSAPMTPPASGITAGQAGRGLTWTAADLTSTTGKIVSGISNRLTCVMIIEFISTTTANNFLFGETVGSVGAYNYGFYEQSSGSLLFFVHNGTTGVNATSAYAASAVRGPQVWVATYDGAEIWMYQNGYRRNSASAQTGNVQRNTTAHLSFQRWNTGGGVNARLIAGAVSNQFMSQYYIANNFNTLENAWNALFQPAKTKFNLNSVAAGAATTNRQYSMVFG